MEQAHALARGHVIVIPAMVAHCVWTVPLVIIRKPKMRATWYVLVCKGMIVHAPIHKLFFAFYKNKTYPIDFFFCVQ